VLDVDELPVALPLPGPAPAVEVHTPATLPRWAALLEVFLACGIPTQTVIGVVLVLGFHIPMFQGGGLSGDLTLEFFAILSLIDTAVIALLIKLFLALSGESSADVFVGARPVRGEVLRGLLLLPVVFALVTGIVLALRAVAPWTHTVAESPLEHYMQTPLDTGIFAVVAMLAGGVREELQRAFILHRFEQRLGGALLGLVVFSVAFGALHVNQGIDVATAVGVLGLIWGILYLRRRSAVMAMVNHASFNGAQVLQVVLARLLGA
jgi:membrane protease YdiL (CAAX protease family)